MVTSLYHAKPCVGSEAETAAAAAEAPARRAEESGSAPSLVSYLGQLSSLSASVKRKC